MYNKMFYSKKFVVLSRYLCFFVLINLSKAQNHDGLKHCCLRDSLNYTQTGDDFYCLGGVNDVQKFKIDCNGFPVDILSFENLDEIRTLENYCYLHHTENDSEFVAAVCIEPIAVRVSQQLLPISFVFLVLTFFIYYRIKTLRGPEDIAFMIAVLCLAIFIFVHVPHFWLANSESLHNIFAFLDLYVAHFAIVGYFAWLNCLMANQLKKNMSSQRMSVTKNWIWLNHIYGWGVPSLVVIITLANVLMDDFNTESEVITSNNYEYSKYVPITILWILNCILLGMVIYYAVKCPSESMNRRVIQYRSRKYLQLFLVSGFLWIFELISWLVGDPESEAVKLFFEITDCINALQGFYLFIVMVILRAHVRRSLAGQKMCCITLPQKWAMLEDSNDVELLPNDQLPRGGPQMETRIGA